MNRPDRSRIPLALIASLAVAAGGFALWPSDSDTSGEASVEPDANVAGPKQVATGEGSPSEGPCSFTPGRRMAYDVKTSSHTTIDMNRLMSQVEIGGGAKVRAEGTAIDQRASRQWHVDLEAVARATDGSTIVAARIDAEPTHTDDGAVGAAEHLSDPFLVRIDRQCSVQEFGWRSEGDLVAARDQQQLVAALAYLAPEQDGASTYVGQVFDSVGRYAAKYSTDGNGQITGRALRYNEAFGTTEGEVSPTFAIDESNIEVTTALGDWFETLSNQRVASLSMHGLPVGTIRSTVQARRVAPRPWSASIDPTRAGWTWGLLLGQRIEGESSTPAVDPALVGVPFSQAMEDFLAVIAAGGKSVDAVPQLVAWLQANPAGASDLVALLRDGGLQGQQSASAGVFLALGMANTDEASAALLEIVGGATGVAGHRVSAALAMSSVESPNEAMVDAMITAAQGELGTMERGSMAMSLGAFASRQAERSPELAGKAREQIGDWLADPRDDEELAGSLLAAGNAGHDDLAPAIDPYLDHDDPGIRQRANHAMRNMSPDAAYPRLEPSLYDDNTAVRASAIEAAIEVSRSSGSALPDTLVDGAIEQLDAGHAPKRERRALVQLLGEAARHGNEGADAVLQQHLRDEMDTGSHNLDKMRELGRHTNTHWEAD